MPEKLAMQEIPAVTQENPANTILVMSIHRRIKQRREELRLSMQSLAKLVDVKAWQTIQQWEKEEGGTAPKRDRLLRVAAALQTTPEYLLFGDSSNKEVGYAVQSAAALVQAVAPGTQIASASQDTSLVQDADLDEPTRQAYRRLSPEYRAIVNDIIQSLAERLAQENTPRHAIAGQR